MIFCTPYLIPDESLDNNEGNLKIIAVQYLSKLTLFPNFNEDYRDTSLNMD